MRLRETELRFVDDSSAAVLPSPDEEANEFESSGISEAFHPKHDDSSCSGGQLSSPPRPNNNTQQLQYLYGRPLNKLSPTDQYFSNIPGNGSIAYKFNGGGGGSGGLESNRKWSAAISPAYVSSVMSSSTSECGGECCGGHAPFPIPTPPDPHAPAVIPATMCKGTQISPTSVIQMYSASLSRQKTIPQQPVRPAPNYANGRVGCSGGTSANNNLLKPVAGDDADVSSQSSSSCVVRFDGHSETEMAATPCKQMNLLPDPLIKVHQATVKRVHLNHVSSGPYPPKHQQIKAGFIFVYHFWEVFEAIVA